MKAVEREIPSGTGIIVFAFDFGDGGGMAYIANAERLSAINALKEWIARQERELT